MTAGWWLVSALVLMTAGGLFGTLSLCLHRFSRGRLADLAARSYKPKLARRVEAIVTDPNEHAAAMALVRIPLQLAAGISAVMWVAGLRGEAMPGWVSALVGVLVASAALWVFVVLVPQAVARHGAERTIAALSGLVRGTHVAFGPLLGVVRFIDEVVRRLSGVDLGRGELDPDAELLSVVTESERDGLIDESERDMIEAVVEFRSTTVEQIMTPRTEIDALAYTDDLQAVLAFVDQHGHSRVPIYEDNLDSMRGILYAKDLLRWIHNHGGNGKPFLLAEILRPVSFVPETKTVRELLTQLLAEQVHIAMVADEYGGTSGLVTMEDIVEEIFGDIQDEYESPEDAVGGVELDRLDRSARIDARTPIDDANDELETLGIELPESDDYDTVGGFVSATLGRIPEPGEAFEHGNARVEILEAEPTRVVRVRVALVEPERIEAGEPGAK
ncbi:MAG: hemolysin family protein [Phycisphaerales bacterium]|nr:HlyC/CorC family transporter [Planctomycetota bacterium]MCH8508136.1 hemolysin family protein [Phycisphaerales bacterium]